MIGKEIPMILEVGMAPDGKIKKPKEEVEEYLRRDHDKGHIWYVWA